MKEGERVVSKLELREEHLLLDDPEDLRPRHREQEVDVGNGRCDEW